MIYLDNAATTFPKPQSVANSLVRGIKCFGGNPGRSGHLLSLRTSEKIYNIRENIANFFGGKTENIIFTSNCTHALNIAIKGILNKGDHIILSDLEHNSVIRPIYAMSKTNNITYDIAKTFENNKEETILSFKKLIKSNTKAVVCTHASNVTGSIMPIKELGSMCKEKNITFIVDAAQSAGILPINIKDMNIDILCTAGHKGLYGPTGTGFLILNDGVKLNTLIEGGTGSLSVDLTQPDFSPDRYESGTINSVGIIGLGAGLEFVKKLSLNRIYEHEFQICNKIYQQIGNMKNVKIYINDFKKYNHVPIVICNIDGITSNQAVSILSDKGYCVRGGLHCSPLAHKKLGTIDEGVIRISPSCFTTNNETMQFLRDFRLIAKK